MSNTLKDDGSHMPGVNGQGVDYSSITAKAAQGGMWLGAFRLLGQVITWLMTIFVVRMLSPDDYGLMAMAGILTGYVEVFSELGLGAAIVQKDMIRESELSSNFWFAFGVGLVFGMAAVLLAYPTAWLFDDPRVVPLTQAMGLLFVIDGLKVVPTNILMRNFRFRTIGAIQLAAATSSGLTMLFLAYRGWGVWTLIGGVAVLRLVLLVFSFLASKWRPKLAYSFEEIRPFLKLGLGIAGSRTLFYVFQNLDKFIVGRVLGAEALGFYSFALNLANMPLEKSMSVLSQVTLPMFSRMQHDLQCIRNAFTSLTKYTNLVIAPVYIGGAVFGEHIILVVLGDKWSPIIFLFRVLCLVQFIGIAVSLSNVMNYALGRSHWAMVFYFVNLLLMPPAIFVALHYGLNSISIPWLVIYPILCGVYVLLSVRAVGLSMFNYVKEGFSPMGAALLMIIGVIATQAVLPVRISGNVTNLLIVEISLGSVIYAAYHLVFNRETVRALIDRRMFQ